MRFCRQGRGFQGLTLLPVLKEGALGFPDHLCRCGAQGRKEGEAFRAVNHSLMEPDTSD